MKFTKEQKEWLNDKINQPLTKIYILVEAINSDSAIPDDEYISHIHSVIEEASKFLKNLEVENGKED